MRSPDKAIMSKARHPAMQQTDALRKAIKGVKFPRGFVSWESRFGQDSSGDPAVWIWVIVDDDAADDPGFTAESTRVSREIREALQRTGSDRWPYVRFRTATEQKSLQAANA